jgi:hypothetical protein
MSNASPSLLEHDAAAEADRGAFNAAFYELGLRWHWDSDAYRALASVPCERSRLRGYMESEQAHLLRAYDAEFLTDAILVAKRRCRASTANCAPRALPQFNWADARWGDTGF